MPMCARQDPLSKACLSRRWRAKSQSAKVLDSVAGLWFWPGLPARSCTRRKKCAWRRSEMPEGFLNRLTAGSRFAALQRPADHFLGAQAYREREREHYSTKQNAES